MHNTVHVRNKVIGRGQPAFIIAEMACAHDGQLQKALDLVDAAVNAGADAIQLQFFRAEETVVPAHDVFNILKRIEFKEEQWSQIISRARKSDIAVFACTYDLPSVAMATRLGVDAIKLNSADLSNPEILIAVANTQLPFTLGTGASTIEEIRAGVETAKKQNAAGIILMHGVQNFPTRTEDLNIRRMGYLLSQFDLPVGYHDHTDGDDPFALSVDLIAVGMGACVIEKHITLDRKQKGIDYQAALEPDELKLFVQGIRRAESALGVAEKTEFSESDLRYRKFQKKSIVAARRIEAGEVINRDVVKYIRNTIPGLPPSEIGQIEGRVAKKTIEQFENIQPEYVG